MGTMDNTKDFNVKFLTAKKHGWRTDYLFELSPEIAERIRMHSRGSRDILNYYLNTENQMTFPIETSHTEDMDSVVKEIERICNARDYEYVLTRLITDQGAFNEFHKVRTILEEEFGLKDRRIQFRVMHFFSDLQQLWWGIW